MRSVVVAEGETSTDDIALRHADAILRLVEQRITQSRIPVSTYRIQFNRDCKFDQVTGLVAYLSTLGISDLYSSPFLQARPGSQHGYDIVNHGAINPEVGTVDGLRQLSSELQNRGMGLIADLVPNHMSAVSKYNPWWQDVLENGPSSQYASCFDIDWMPLKPDLAGKVLLPVLGDQFGKILESGQLRIQYEEGAFWLKYHDHRFPLAPRSYSLILSPNLDALEVRLGKDHSDLLELLSVLTALKNLPPRTETGAERLLERRREKEVVKQRLHRVVTRSPEIADFVAANVSQLNGKVGESQSFDLLDQLLRDQAYRLAYWRVAADEINYRRFFDINELAAICTEEPRVFEESHRLLLQLMNEGVVTGVRIDHPDGLYDPYSYLMELQQRYFQQMCRKVYLEQKCCDETAESSPLNLAVDWDAIWAHLSTMWRTASQFAGARLRQPLFVVVEKILMQGESPPEDWPVHGTVGYDFLNVVNGLFVNSDAERALTKLYSHFTRQYLSVDELEDHDKRLIVRMSMGSELNVLGHRLDRISERNRLTRDFTLTSLIDALREVITCFKVYRTYVRPDWLLERDRHFIEAAITDAKLRNPAMDGSVFDFIRDVLLLRIEPGQPPEERRALEQFVGKFQQLTGPIMAKAVEDTTCYRFNRLTSLNEVGCNLATFGVSIDRFHEINQARAALYPHSFNATSTHDTKRSEDVRARIHVISEIPNEWRDRVKKWSRWNRALKTMVNGVESPSRNAEYLLYQTLVGTWPGPLSSTEPDPKYISRIQTYMLKVVREAKIHTSWINTNHEYEASIPRFVSGLLDRPTRPQFLADLNEFAQGVANHGYWNSLSQPVLKVFCPGIPDLYQGSELWNLTLVDPDNRQTIDFDRMKATLNSLTAEMGRVMAITGSRCAIESWLDATCPGDSKLVSSFLDGVLHHKDDGRTKMFATLISLRLRKRLAALFTHGDYIPLQAIGRFASHVVAFARRSESGCVVVIVPRLTVGLVGKNGPAPLGSVWKDTEVVLPQDLFLGDPFEVFSRRVIQVVKNSGSAGLIPLCDALQDFPAGVLHAQH